MAKKHFGFLLLSVRWEGSLFRHWQPCCSCHSLWGSEKFRSKRRSLLHVADQHEEAIFIIVSIKKLFYLLPLVDEEELLLLLLLDVADPREEELLRCTLGLLDERLLLERVTCAGALLR